MFGWRRVIGMGVVAAVVVVGAAACGGDDDDDGDVTPAATAAATKAASPTAAATAEAAIVVRDAWARNAPMGGMMTPGAGMTPMMTPGGMMTPGAGMTPMMTPGAGMTPMMTPGAGARGAAYMIIENTGSEADALVAAESAVSNVTEVHESKMEGDQVTMQEVERIDIPAGESVELKPGGYHVMFIDLKQALTVGDEITIDLTFENAGTISVTAEVRDQ